MSFPVGARVVIVTGPSLQGEPWPGAELQLGSTGTVIEDSNTQPYETCVHWDYDSDPSGGQYVDTACLADASIPDLADREAVERWLAS